MGVRRADGARPDGAGISVRVMISSTKAMHGHCIGGTGALPETCDGTDEDCDGRTDENPGGTALPGTGVRCGATDTGRCAYGTVVCTGGSLTCGGGLVGPATETCNGVDDDCDERVDEDVPVGAACDDDADGCAEGTSACVGGLMICEGDDADRVGTACDDGDADLVAEGMLACVADALVCEDDCTPTTETCNRRDDDCDGEVDEEVCEAGNGDCTAVTDGSSVYYFCEDADSWNQAAGECAALGAVLAEVDTDFERRFLRMHAGSDSWWVGARAPSGNVTDEGNWSWADSGTPVREPLWADNEPSGDGRCAQMWNLASHRLNDLNCDWNIYFICEADVLP